MQYDQKLPGNYNVNAQSVEVSHSVFMRILSFYTASVNFNYQTLFMATVYLLY